MDAMALNMSEATLYWGYLSASISISLSTMVRIAWMDCLVSKSLYLLEM